MAELGSIIELIQTAGFTGLLIILAVPRLRKNIFGMNGYDVMQSEIKRIGDSLVTHMHDEESAMKATSAKISRIESDIAFIKGKLDK